MKLKISKETRIGLVLALSIALFFWGFNFLKGKNFFSSGRSYYAIFNRTGGLLTSAAVLARDFQVGVVDKIYFHPSDTGRIVVKFIIFEKNLKIPIDSRIFVYATDPLGTRGLRLEVGKSDKLVENGDTITNSRVSPTLTEQLTDTFNPVSQKVEGVVASLDSVLVIIRQIFNPKTQQSLSTGFQSLEGSLKSIEHATNQLDELLTGERSRFSRVMANFESISTNLAKNNDKLSSIFANVNDITDQVAKSNVQQTLTSLNKTSESLKLITLDIQDGKGTMGKLAKDDSLYNNLNSSAANLSKLLDDLEKNPKKYVHFSVFGRKAK